MIHISVGVEFAEVSYFVRLSRNREKKILYYITDRTIKFNWNY